MENNKLKPNTKYRVEVEDNSNVTRVYENEVYQEFNEENFINFLSELTIKYNTHPMIGYHTGTYIYSMNTIKKLEELFELFKPLSQEDFKDLGFEIHQWGASKGDIVVEFDIYDPNADTIDIYCVEDLRFKGKIKNKSELIKVLEQLNLN